MLFNPDSLLHKSFDRIAANKWSHGIAMALVFCLIGYSIFRMFNVAFNAEPAPAGATEKLEQLVGLDSTIDNFAKGSRSSFFSKKDYDAGIRLANRHCETMKLSFDSRTPDWEKKCAAAEVLLAEIQTK